MGGRAEGQACTDPWAKTPVSYILIDNLKFVFLSRLPSCALKTLIVFTSERVVFIACLLLSEYSFERLYHIANFEHDRERDRRVYKTSDALTDLSGSDNCSDLPYHLSWFGYTDYPVRPPPSPVRPTSEVSNFFFWWLPISKQVIQYILFCSEGTKLSSCRSNFTKITVHQSVPNFFESVNETSTPARLAPYSCTVK